MYKRYVRALRSGIMVYCPWNIHFFYETKLFLGGSNYFCSMVFLVDNKFTMSMPKICVHSETLYYKEYLYLWIAEDLAALDRELADEEDYFDISKHGIVEIVGDDSAGRKIIVVSACKLPPIGKEVFNHAKLLR